MNSPSPAPWPHTIAILAGGGSRRMGEPKHTLRLPDGRSLADLALSVARASARRVIVSGPATVLPDLEHVADHAPGGGPVAGIAAVLARGGDERYLFLPCDMPGLTPGMLARLAGSLDQANATIFENPGAGPRPVLPLGLRASAPVGESIGHGQSIHGLLEALDPALVPLEVGEEQLLFNINTPGEWSDFIQSPG